MQFLVLFACALATASAGHLVAPIAYGAQHLPVIGANGVPVDTAEVQHATAAHLIHKAEAHARNGDFAVYGHAAYAHAAPVAAYSAYAHAPVVSAYSHAAPLVAAYAGHHHAAAYPTTAVLPQSINGVPLETPEVVAAKANHFAAHAEANARTALHYRYRRGVIAAPLAYSAGHAAYASPLAYNAYAYGAQHLPVIGANGVPVDTPAVQHATAAHLAHKVEAHVRNGDYAVAAPAYAYGAYGNGAYAHGAYAHASPAVSAYSAFPYSYGNHAYGYGYSSPLAHYY